MATSAFGMGINKRNLRFIIYAGLPLSLEAYYQGSGRAGSDNKHAKCIILYNQQKDLKACRWLIDQNTNPINKNISVKKLEEILFFCKNKQECRKLMILKYFGSVEKRCQGTDNFCDNCMNVRKDGVNLYNKDGAQDFNSS